jgi:hypothetical protein
MVLLAARPDVAYDLCDYMPLCADEATASNTGILLLFLHFVIEL